MAIIGYSASGTPFYDDVSTTGKQINKDLYASYFQTYGATAGVPWEYYYKYLHLNPQYSVASYGMSGTGAGALSNAGGLSGLDYLRDVWRNTRIRNIIGGKSVRRPRRVLRRILKRRLI